MTPPSDTVEPPLTRTPPEGVPPVGPEVAEEAGTQALADALRSSFFIIKLIMVGLVLVFLGSGMVIIKEEEKGVILRLGKPVGVGAEALLQPGLHWSLPFPIDEVVRIPVARVQTVSSTIGWYATTAVAEAAKTEAPPTDTLNPALDGYTLTADGNIIHVRGTLRYRIAEPGLAYTFDFASASNLVQNALNNALVYASAHYRVDDALTRDIAGFRERVRQRLELNALRQGLGITVDQMDVEAAAPRQLKAQFDAVLEAEVRRGQAINQARSYDNQIVTRARADTATRLASAQTDRTRLVEFVAAEAQRFLDLLPAYRSNPELFLRQRQTEVVQRVLTNAQDKIVLPLSAGGKMREVRIQLNREPQKVKPIALPKPEEGH